MVPTTVCGGSIARLAREGVSPIPQINEMTQVHEFRAAAGLSGKGTGMAPGYTAPCAHTPKAASETSRQASNSANRVS